MRMGQVEAGAHGAPRKRASQERSQPLGMGEMSPGGLRVAPMHRRRASTASVRTRNLLPDAAGVDLRRASATNRAAASQSLRSIAITAR